MARFAIDSARSGIELIKQLGPHEAQAFFLAMGLITNTRAIFFALVNSDAKRSEAHRDAIGAWRKKEKPELRRFERVVVAARNQFTKEFSAIPLVVVITGNVGEPRHEIPLYIPFTPDLDEVLTSKERKWRAILSRTEKALAMRVDLVRECEGALGVWSAESDKIEADIRALQTN